mgnify:CR=1 FL=1
MILNPVIIGKQETPVIEVSSSGLITATAGDKSATKQLTTQAAQTITPGTANKTIASGRYLTGAQTIKGDANLVAANIVSGKSIFGVVGTAKVEKNASLRVFVQPGNTTTGVLIYDKTNLMFITNVVDQGELKTFELPMYSVILIRPSPGTVTGATKENADVYMGSASYSMYVITSEEATMTI